MVESRKRFDFRVFVDALRATGGAREMSQAVETETEGDEGNGSIQRWMSKCAFDSLWDDTETHVMNF